MISTSISARWSNISNDYDQYRLSPPKELIQIIAKLSRRNLQLVVDFGCGTGLSTFPWKSVSKKVLGLDPMIEMLNFAQNSIKSDNVEFQLGNGEKSGLKDNSVDIAIFTHSIHWMEPEGTISEIKRILKKNGLFVILGHNFPPLSEFLEVDRDYFQFKNKCDTLALALNLDEGSQLNMAEFAKYLIQKNMFSVYREFYYNHQMKWSAKDYVGWLYTHGIVQKLVQLNIDEAEFGLDLLKKKVFEYFGENECFIMPVWRTIVFKDLM